jgi:hypothetical protein
LTIIKSIFKIFFLNLTYSFFLKQLKIEDLSGKIFLSRFDPLATVLIGHLMQNNNEYFLKIRLTLSKASCIKIKLLKLGFV